MSYDELMGHIKQMPITWIPALLVVVVQRAIREDVFKEGGLLLVVRGAMEGATTKPRAK